MKFDLDDILGGFGLLMMLIVVGVNLCIGDEDTTTSKTSSSQTQKIEVKHRDLQVEAHIKEVERMQREIKRAGSLSEYMKQQNAIYNQLNTPKTYSKPRPATPDDAYSEGYDNGYYQGEQDGENGEDYGAGYDDCTDYYNYYETRYKVGYEEGYDEGYYTGRDNYEEEIEEESEEEEYW